MDSLWTSLWTPFIHTWAKYEAIGLVSLESSAFVLSAIGIRWGDDLFSMKTRQGLDREWRLDKDLMGPRWGLTGSKETRRGIDGALDQNSKGTRRRLDGNYMGTRWGSLRALKSLISSLTADLATICIHPIDASVMRKFVRNA
jgi:hypothetical protein